MTAQWHTLERQPWWTKASLTFARALQRRGRIKARGAPRPTSTTSLDLSGAALIEIGAAEARYGPGSPQVEWLLHDLELRLEAALARKHARSMRHTPKGLGPELRKELGYDRSDL